MGTVVLTTAVSSILIGLFGYLKYRAYLQCVRHIADRHGVKALRMLDRIAPPTTAGLVISRGSGAASEQAERPVEG